MASVGTQGKRDDQSARSSVWVIMVIFGWILVATSLGFFVLAQFDDDAHVLLQGIYAVLLGLGMVAYGEFRNWSAADGG